VIALRKPSLGIFLLIAAGFVLGAPSALADELQVRAVRGGRPVPIAHADDMAANAVALLESCTVNATQSMPEKAWERQLESDSYLHVVFPKARELRLKSLDNESRATLAVKEILVPLPEGKWPAHIYARTEKEALSFAKYSGVPLKDIIMDPDLRIGSVPPYDFLMKSQLQ
jgi:hypothetical protein